MTLSLFRASGKERTVGAPGRPGQNYWQARGRTIRAVSLAPRWLACSSLRTGCQDTGTAGHYSKSVEGGCEGQDAQGEMGKNSKWLSRSFAAPTACRAITSNQCYLAGVVCLSATSVVTQRTPRDQILNASAISAVS